MRYRLIVIIGLTGLLTGIIGCSDDGDDESRRELVSVSLSAYTTPFTDVESSSSRTTRAWGEWPPSGYLPYHTYVDPADLQKSNDGAAIGAYFTQSSPAEVAYARKFRPFTGDKWLINDSVDVGDYYLYGFVPYGAVDANTTTIAPFNGSYKNGAVLELRGINSVLSQDLCVVVAAKDGTLKNDVPLPKETPKPGDFSCEFKKENYIFLLFDHLYAALRFRFQVGEKYAKLRTIKLRRLELSAYQDEACTVPMTKVRTTITLEANNKGTSPIVRDVSFSADGTGAAEAAIICDRESNPVTLPTGDAWTEYLGFGPKTSKFYLLRTTYDVYDNNPSKGHSEGNLIRQKCVAENKIIPQQLFTNLSSLARGYMYTINLTIEPTYLYMLSEPDLDNPVLKVKN